MLIEQKQIVIKTEKKEVKLPYYCEDKDHVYALFDEKTVVVVTKQRTNYLSITKSTFYVYEGQISEAIPITRDLFDNWLNDGLSKIKSVSIPPFKNEATKTYDSVMNGSFSKLLKHYDNSHF